MADQTSLSAASPPRRALPVVPAFPAVTAVTVPWWAFVVVVVGLGLVFLALQENGALLASQANLLHEFFHDGRHALGVPCH